jgi:hypothetical protein
MCDKKSGKRAGTDEVGARALVDFQRVRKFRFLNFRTPKEARSFLRSRFGFCNSGGYPLVGRFPSLRAVESWRSQDDRTVSRSENCDEIKCSFPAFFFTYFAVFPFTDWGNSTSRLMDFKACG